LLTHALETLHLNRVQLRARDTNLRSRAAILKIGATFEGIQRKLVIRFGEARNIAVYSIIDSEWAAVKQELQQKVNNLP
jgi:RimJ/RimL family protein N-acetyltransferase